ncbi:hypothetical protein [Persicobacter psychrovividus]
MKKAVKFTSNLMVLIITLVVFALFIEDYLFFKSDVKACLAEHNIELLHDFELEYNDVSSLMDYSHQFELEISAEDKERLMSRFLSSPNYIKDAPEMFDIRSGKPRYSEKEIQFTATYDDIRGVEYQSFRPSKKGHKPIWEIITIKEKENRLIYLRILE